MEKDTQNRQHATAQGEIIESKTGSMPELGGPTHPSLFGTFQDLRLKVHVLENSSVPDKLKSTM